MDNINFTHRQFDKLKRVKLSREILNTEGSLFNIPVKNKWNYDNKLVKRLFLTEGQVFGNKLKTINSLVDNSEAFDDTFVLPEKLVSVDEEIIGFLLPFIENDNLGIILKDYNTDIKTKKEYLKEIGKLLMKIDSMNKYQGLNNFHIGDLHENNFIISKSDKKLHVVDLDSCKIDTNDPFSSKYLSTSPYLRNLKDKYPSIDNNIIASDNSDLYCYNIMILNFLFSSNIQMLKLDEFYDYLEYLKDLGYNQELLDSFYKLYNNTNNENPVDLIDSIPDDVTRAHHMSYKLSKGKFY